MVITVKKQVQRSDNCNDLIWEQGVEHEALPLKASSLGLHLMAAARQGRKFIQCGCFVWHPFPQSTYTLITGSSHYAV